MLNAKRSEKAVDLHVILTLKMNQLKMKKKIKNLKTKIKKDLLQNWEQLLPPISISIGDGTLLKCHNFH